MTIAQLTKVALVFPATATQPVLNALQHWGQLHIIEQRNRTPAEVNAESIKQTELALRYLQNCPAQRTNINHSNVSIPTLIEKILHNRSARLDLEQTQNTLQNKIKTVKPWGYFRWPTQRHLNGQRLWFYCLPHGQEQKVSAELKSQIVYQDTHHTWMVIVAEHEPTQDQIPFARTHIGQQTLAELESEQEAAQVLMEDLNAERSALTRWLSVLDSHYKNLLSEQALFEARSALDTDQRVSHIVGWCETQQLESLNALLAPFHCVLVQLARSDDEDPPTLLKNPKALQAAQKLVTFFQFPGYDDWDPTPVLHLSFIVFYAMIMADAGYGLITLGIGLWVQWRRPAQRIWSQLIIQLGMVSTLYGVLVGSYFGISPPDDSLLTHAQLFDLNAFDQMMTLSLFVGMAHLGLALLIKFRCHTGSEKWMSLSWLWLLICAAFYLITDHLASVYAMLITPAIWAWTSLFYGQNLLSRIQLFFAPFMQLSKLFGDVLSYMRLFALGLASASLAMTFNQLSLDIRDSFPGMGVLLSVIILVLGHLLNFALAIMGGVVHSMRLNCIEFFNWALNKEGYAFNPFKRF